MARVEIPRELAASVLFASDRTCCVCHDAKRKTQLHHIDEDASNNSFENLAVICSDCHSDAHTTHAFARNLTPDLIRKYNDNWRAVVRARLCAGGEAALLLEYRLQVLLQLSMAPHQWKIIFLTLYSDVKDIGRKMDNAIGDVFIKLKSPVPDYDTEQWHRYSTLFSDGSFRVINSVECIIATYGDVIPVSVKLASISLRNRLETESIAYTYVPQLGNMCESVNQFFRMRFTETLDALSQYNVIVENERSATQRCEPQTMAK